MTPARAHPGFTLIELVIVLTVVAILAALAMPRFISLQREARISKLQFVQGAIKSAAVLARARCEVDLHGGSGPCTATGGQVAMEGANIDMQNRYPAASASGIDQAAQISPTEGIVPSAGGPEERVFDIAGAEVTGHCRVSYMAAPAGSAPVITLDSSGC